MDEIVNKVAASGLVTINLEELYPQGERISIDLADQLWQGLALKEKDFRAWIADHDWSQYTQKHVAVFCSVDAILPAWSFMLVTTRGSAVLASSGIVGSRNVSRQTLCH